MSNRREKFLTGGKGWWGGAHTVLLKSSRVTCLGLIPGHGLLCLLALCARFSGQLLGVLSVGSLPVSTSLRRIIARGCGGGWLLI